jgi:hypothetical protein
MQPFRRFVCFKGLTAFSFRAFSKAFFPTQNSRGERIAKRFPTRQTTTPEV